VRIGIVNDMPMALEILRRTISGQHDYQVAWLARDGKEAVQKCVQDTPDLVLMDLIMPTMDGVEATRIIMDKTPCAILVVTASVDGNITQVFEAMGNGALDAVNTPVLGQPQGQETLIKKIEVIRKLLGNPATSRKTVLPQKPVEGDLPPLVAIGASTGGPQAIAAILSKIPKNTAAAFIVVQHVDAFFANGLAEWLKHKCSLKIQLAEPGQCLTPGRVYIAAKNDHLIFGHSHTLQYTAEPEDYPYRPSVDILFESLAANYNRPGIAVLLTGMGRDGAKGLLMLKNAAWHTIAQDEKTSVVYGMPKAAKELDAAVQILPLERIAAEILLRVNETDEN